MKSEAELLKLRKQAIAEIQKRGGQKNAPRWSEQLKDIDASLAKVRGGAATGGGATTTEPPATTKEVFQGQKNLADQATTLATEQLGGVSTAFNPTLAPEFSQGDLAADRARIEGDVYGRLTRNLDQQQGRDTAAAKQSLYNRGIAYSADPNSRYQQEMRDLTQRYDDARLNAQRTATEIGGTEYQRGFDINQTQRNNQYNQQLGTRQQNVSDINSLANLGIGAIQGFEQLSDADKLRALQNRIAQLQSKTAIKTAEIGAGASKYAADKSAASRGGGQEEEESPFVG